MRTIHVRILLTLAAACGLFLSVSNCLASPVLVGLWRFDEGLGTNVLDSSGFTNNGVLLGDEFPTWVQGQPGFGKALRFVTGRYSYVDIPGSYSLKIGMTPTNAWSITAWAYENSDGTSNYVATSGRIIVIDDGWALSFYSGYQTYPQMSTGSRATPFDIPWTTRPPLDQWIHWALVYNGSNLRVYRNGGQGPLGSVQTKPVTAALSFQGYTGAVRIGAELYMSENKTWNGMLDDVAVFSGALTQTQILAIMGGDFSSFLGGPPHIVRQPESRTAEPDSQVSFNVVCQGAGPIRYSWYFNQTNSLPETSSALTLQNVQSTQTGEYSVIASNELGVATSDSAVLIVNTNGGGLIGLWRFDEGGGTNAMDSSGFNNGGVLKGLSGNFPNWVSGQPGFGSALRFTNDALTRAYVEIPGSSSLKIGQTAANRWTITLWAYEESDFNGFISSHGRMIVLDNREALALESGASGDAQMYTSSLKNPDWEIGWGSGSTGPLLDEWVHWALVYDGSTLKLFRDGNQGISGGVQTNVVSVALGFAEYTGSIRIGSELLEPMNSGPHANVNWNGMIDDVAIFNVALSQAQVRTVMSGNFNDFIARVPLSASLAGSNVVVSWSALLPGVRLESTPSIANPQWAMIPAVPVQRGAVLTVTLPAQPGSRFFRLTGE
jgi:hypothetical protein